MRLVCHGPRRETTLTQQRFGAGKAAAEGLVGVGGIARAAGGVNRLLQPLGGRRIENIAGFFKSLECVGVENLRPHVTVVAGRISAAGEYVTKMRRTMAHDDLFGHVDARKRTAFAVSR